MAQQPLFCQGLLIIEVSTITLRHTTFGRTPLDERLAHHKYLYLTTHKTERHPWPPAGFEPVISASQRPQTHATGILIYVKDFKMVCETKIYTVYASDLSTELKGELWTMSYPHDTNVCREYRHTSEAFLTFVLD
jgi:hypothetical protein